MSRLRLHPNLDRPDAFYARLLAAHEGLDPAASEALNARLILVLANHIGDETVLTAALEAAASAGRPGRQGSQSALKGG